MKAFFERAIDNISKLGDTDVFPFPFENHIFFDKRESMLALLDDIHANFLAYIDGAMPVTKEVSLSLVGYTGFRSATMVDPVWNAYLLALVLSLTDDIESARATPSDAVFSYRYNYDEETKMLFNDGGWNSFRERSIELAQSHSFVLVSDIADFYPRIYHHRLEAQLGRVNTSGSDAPWRIMKILQDLSGNTSYGLPVGGPAARILSELCLNGPDRLLANEGFVFCRYSDDFHIFCNSVEDAYRAMIRVSEVLALEGLSLQKHKTRIVTAAEFLKSSMVDADEVEEQEGDGGGDTQNVQSEERRSFLRLSLRYDPYSATAQEDYDNLRTEIEKFDILGMLTTELQKSRVHVALTRRLVRAIQFLDAPQQAAAATALVENVEVLAPLFPSVMIALKELLPELTDEEHDSVLASVRRLLEDGHYLTEIDVNRAFATRVISERHTPESEAVLAQIYSQAPGFLRKDIILVMSRWNNWPWLSEVKSRFQDLRGPERRAFIVASYKLGDEGAHWRTHTKATFSEFEKVIVEWASEKAQAPGWVVPL